MAVKYPKEIFIVKFETYLYGPKYFIFVMRFYKQRVQSAANGTVGYSRELISKKLDELFEVSGLK